MKKLILVDADGVLLNWDDAFDWWMLTKKNLRPITPPSYCVATRFGMTESAAFDFICDFNDGGINEENMLAPLRDSIRFVRKLHEEEGFIFRVITAFSENPYSQRLRVENLTRYFGSAIQGVDFVDTCADKRHFLEPYKDSGIPWIEDKLGNCELGLKLGLDPYMMMHGYNFDDSVKTEYADDIFFVSNWEDIYNRIVGE